MNYRINSTKIGIKDFYIKKLIAIDNNIEKLKKELQKEKKKFFKCFENIKGKG